MGTAKSAVRAEVAADKRLRALRMQTERDGSHKQKEDDVLVRYSRIRRGRESCESRECMMGVAQRDAEGLAELERLAAFFAAVPASTSQQAAGEHVDDGGGNARRDIARSVYVEEQEDRRGVG
eukprot:CAMPEP_0173096250 /NCGR_PEP_ID=MMETSP1102-20130122/32712_1 /TAXON_ID=49646 /ORGANISM="Geminigera sp., Strain Caron Lab Isolate" /LENGTH=122 /DNA_ID=CAMNT_0013986897 /DNA_START=174 /DNA_END=538 /DNA_ORIENTATION=+